MKKVDPNKIELIITPDNFVTKNKVIYHVI